MKNLRLLALLAVITISSSACADETTYGTDSNGNTYTITKQGDTQYGQRSDGYSWQTKSMTGGGQTYSNDSNGNSWSTQKSTPDQFVQHGIGN